MFIKLLLILFIVVVACIVPKFKLKSEGGMRTILAETLKKDLEINAENVVVINVLAEDYYADCRIAGSINIPLAEITQERVAHYKGKEKLILYCAHEKCTASADAYRKIVAFGFTNVIAYEGGIKEWRQKGFATEGVCQADYLR